MSLFSLLSSNLAFYCTATWDKVQQESQTQLNVWDIMMCRKATTSKFYPKRANMVSSQLLPTTTLLKLMGDLRWSQKTSAEWFLFICRTNCYVLCCTALAARILVLFSYVAGGLVVPTNIALVGSFFQSAKSLYKLVLATWVSLRWISQLTRLPTTS